MGKTQWWFNWLLMALAAPVQFYLGGQYYLGAYKALRNRLADHVYFETAAVIITLIKLSKYLEART